MFEGATFEDLTPEDETPKRTRRPRSDKGVPRGTGTRRTGSRNKVLVDELLVGWAGFSTAFAMTLPTVSAVMLTRGEQTMTALVGIAGNNPRMLAALKKASKVGPAMELGRTVAEILVAASLDSGRMPPEHPMAILLGVADLYRQVHPDMPVPGGPSSPPGNGFPAYPMQGEFTPFAVPAQGA